MPGLVSDAELVAARVAHAEAVSSGVVGQPLKSGGIFKLLGKDFAIRRTDIERPARVMFAVAGRGVDGKYFFYRLAARQFFRDQIMLILRAAESRDEKHLDPLSGRGLFHRRPGPTCRLRELLRTAETIGLGRHETPGYDLQRQETLPPEIGGYAQSPMQAVDLAFVFRSLYQRG